MRGQRPVRRTARDGPRAVARVYRRATGEEVVQRRAEGCTRRCGIGSPAEDLLEWRVRESVSKHTAVNGWRGGVRGPALGEPEVQKDNLAARCPLEIRGFDVPVNDGGSWPCR